MKWSKEYILGREVVKEIGKKGKFFTDNEERWRDR